MSNQIYKNELYSNKNLKENTKERFLSSIEGKGSTYDTYRRVFIKSFRTENSLKKDLYEMNFDELEQVLKDMNAKTLASIYVTSRIISSYLDWAIEEGYMMSNINEISQLRREEFKKYIDHSVTMFITEDEFKSAYVNPDYVVNAQDRCIFYLLWEGLDIHEARNLRKSDVKDNTLKLTNNNGDERPIQVSDDCIKEIYEAISQRDYIKNNGDYDDSARSDKYAGIIDTDYILRPVKRGSEENEPVKPHVIHQRIKKIAKDMDNQYLSSKNISRSGMIAMAYHLIKTDDELREITRDDLVKICEQYNVGKIKTRPDDYNISPLKEFVNLETIKELYSE